MLYTCIHNYQALILSLTLTLTLILNLTLAHHCICTGDEFTVCGVDGISADKLRKVGSGRCRRFSAELVLLLMFLM